MSAALRRSATGENAGHRVDSEFVIPWGRAGTRFWNILKVSCDFENRRSPRSSQVRSFFLEFIPREGASICVKIWVGQNSTVCGEMKILNSAVTKLCLLNKPHIIGVRINVDSC